MKHLPTILLLITALTMTFVSSSEAHKIRVFAWEENGQIQTESKFSGGRAAKNVTVSVVDMKTDTELLTGKTDDTGLFSFPIPKPEVSELKIIVDGGDGHKGSWMHTLDNTVTPAQPAAGSNVQTEPVDQHPQEAASAQAAPLLINAAELSRLIEQAVEKKLGPIRKTLAENAEKGPTLQDILGGIGYIFGLAGIAAYMQSRRKEKE